MSTASVTVRNSKTLGSLLDWVAISYFDFKLILGMSHLLLGIITPSPRPGFGLGIVPSRSCQLSKYQIPNTASNCPPPSNIPCTQCTSIAFRLYCDWWILVHYVLLTAAVIGPRISLEIKVRTYKLQISISDTFDISLWVIKPPQTTLTHWGVELHRKSLDVHNACPQGVNKSRYHFTPIVKKLLVM